MIDGLDRLIEATATPSEPFRVELGDQWADVELWYQVPSTFAGWASWRKERDDWVEQHLGASCPIPGCESLWPRDKESMATLFTLHGLSRNREISLQDAMKIMTSVVLVETILVQIELNRQKATAEGWNNRVAEAKKKSSLTDGSATDLS